MVELVVKSPANARQADAITREIVKGRLRSSRVEMETLLERTAMSAFIREKKDYFVAIYDAAGRLVYGSNSPSGSAVMECILERYAVKDMLHGDIYIYNDPYVSRGGVTHTPDMVFAAPVFADDGPLVGFSVCWAHHTDIGGLAAGT
ncbi:hydantoinase B/oxoprolinase family protein, partial [Comamonadaceae bacterium G21597-S1]|nr:hydantoinase B/oxoprolinase family protein [Comamonadaceae bacterium G21597-S1]